ncbi:MAG: hypothetical protein WC779_05560, partial [Candidatus Omnitrophota bacterium]
IFLLSVLLVGLLGTFFISRLSTLHAEHRFVAMNIAREFLELEIMLGGEGGEEGEDDGYGNSLITSAASINVTIDDRGTADVADDLIGTVTPDPYPADMRLVGVGTSQAQYKVIGFVVAWNEDVFGNGPQPRCTERVLTYVSYH